MLTFVGNFNSIPLEEGWKKVEGLGGNAFNYSGGLRAKVGCSKKLFYVVVLSTMPPEPNVGILGAWMISKKMLAGRSA